MTDIRSKVFFIIGADFFRRQEAIENIKQRVLKGTANSLNTITFYGKEINLDDLKEKTATSSFAGTKLLIFKEANSLASEVKDFLLGNLKKLVSNHHIILEVEKDYGRLQQDKKIMQDKFFNLLLKNATLIKPSSVSREFFLEDLKKYIRKSDLSAALYILEKLFEGKIRDEKLGPQVLGLLVSEFSYLKNPLEKEKCFRYLWEADRAIKEKGLDSKLALEIALVRMMLS